MNPGADKAVGKRHLEQPSRQDCTYFCKKTSRGSPAPFHAQIPVRLPNSSLSPRKNNTPLPSATSFPLQAAEECCTCFCKVASTSIKLHLLFQVTEQKRGCAFAGLALLQIISFVFIRFSFYLELRKARCFRH